MHLGASAASSSSSPSVGPFFECYPAIAGPSHLALVVERATVLAARALAHDASRQKGAAAKLKIAALTCVALCLSLPVVSSVLSNMLQYWVVNMSVSLQLSPRLPRTVRCAMLPRRALLTHPLCALCVALCPPPRLAWPTTSTTRVELSCK